MKVLLVCDHTYFRISLKDGLEKVGFDVRSAYDGVEGVQLLLENPHYSAVISDFEFGPMDGVSFLSAATILSPKIVTILVEDTETSSLESTDKINLVLKKPFQRTLWVQAIDHSLH